MMEDGHTVGRFECDRGVEVFDVGAFGFLGVQVELRFQMSVELESTFVNIFQVADHCQAQRVNSDA